MHKANTSSQVRPDLDPAIPKKIVKYSLEPVLLMDVQIHYLPGVTYQLLRCVPQFFHDHELTRQVSDPQPRTFASAPA